MPRNFFGLSWDAMGLSFGDLDASGLVVGVGFVVDGSFGAAGRGTDQLDDDFAAGQRGGRASCW